MRVPTLLAALLALLLLPASAAQAARLSSSAASAAAERVAERYADATDAADHGVDACERRGRTAFACDLFVSIEVDELTQRECTATVTVRLGKGRRAKPTVSPARWACEDQAFSDEDDGAADEPVEDEEEFADEDA
jgi:hypothetical protein